MEEKEDLKGLQFLATNKQKKAYTRMVSEEFSCAESHVPVQGGRQRRRSKKSSSSSINTETDELDISSPEHISLDPLTLVLSNEKDDSEESEYFSAEEEQDQCFLDESFSGDDSDDQGQCESVDPLNKIASLCTFKVDTSSILSKGRSKKQKKKRKELVKLEGPALAFCNAGYMDVDFVDLKEELAQSTARSAFAEVPSLVELCIIASRKLPQSRRMQTLIPREIKSIFKLFNNRLGLQKIQLSWLFKILPFIEYEVQDHLNKYELPFSYRNIWCSDMYSKKILANYDRQHSYNEISATCYLPHTFVWSTHIHIQIEYLINSFRLSALANVIDLMLLPTVPHKTVNRKRGFSSQSEEDMLSADAERMLLRIKSELEKKFPFTIKYFYHQALPYMFWARGLISKAANLFSDLASKEEKCRLKARYLYEVGRMYSHFDEAETAIVFYKGAEDAILAKPKYRKERIISEVEQQTRNLCADAYDQGPMTKQKAEQASKSWNLAILLADRGQLQTHHPGIYAADSLLCFHAGIGRDNVKSWLLSCVECLEKISRSCPQVYIYLSQIYAWAGMTKESTTAYKTYLNIGYVGNSTSAHGQQQTVSSLRMLRQPWGVLLQMVQRPTVGTPKPLSVLWRTRLGPPRFYNVTEPHGSWEADIRSVDVNLTLSKDGKITGDFEMLLPPVRGVQLDPHTGILSFPHVPGETVTWKSFYEFRFDRTAGLAYGPTFIPTPVELYCDHHGNRVHLLCSSVMVTTVQAKANTNILIWTGADGRRSKVNLNVKVREAVYKMVDKKLDTFYMDEERLEQCKKLLRKCFETGKIMDPNGIKARINLMLSSSKKKSTNCKRPYKIGPFTCTLKNPARFSSSIVIPIFFPLGQVVSDMCFVFVDCSSLEAFLDPKVCITKHCHFYTGNPFSGFLTPVTSMLSLPHADLIPLTFSSSEVVYYDKHGEEFDRVFLSDVKLECGTPQVYRNLVYYVNVENSLVQGLNGNGTVVEHFAFVNKMAICRNVIIMTTLENLIFADAISCLPLEVLLSDKITPSLPNGVDCKENVYYFKVIGEKEIVKDSGIKYNLVAIAINTHLVVVEVPLCEDPEFVEITMCVEVSGRAKDICFISSYVGILVSVVSENFPRETLHHFDSSGRLQGLLPGLGKGPRSFLPLMLPIKTDEAESDRKAWHIYMRDGHDGIMCIVLE